MNIVEKIIFLRKEILKLNQTEFADKLNVSRTTVYFWENGMAKPNLDHIILICALCFVSPDYLLNDNDKDFEVNPIGLDDQGYKIISDLIKYFERTNNQNEKQNLAAF